MTGLDIIVLLLAGGGLVFGARRGFVCEILSLGAWIAAIAALKLLHTPVTAALEGPVGTWSGAAVLAFALVFGLVFIAGKLISHRIGAATRRSIVGPLDRVLGAGFGALKGLIGATLLYLAANLVYDVWNGRAAPRPAWMAESRSYPLLNASGRAILDFVEWRRGPAPEQGAAERNGLGNAARAQ
ncbi:MAG: CvpA family protein [Pseudomonadota bacterium]|nr:CvpA family protein [Pseudomonadota bacterium]